MNPTAADGPAGRTTESAGSDAVVDAVARLGRAPGAAVMAVGRNRRGLATVVAEELAVTNAHNVRGAEITVWPDGTDAVTATVVGVDIDEDLAVLRVEGLEIAVPELGGTDGLRAGSRVYAISLAPDGVPRVTLGRVSATERAFSGPHGRRIQGSVEHTAPLPPGSSGGPLVDSAGRVVAINTHRLDGGFYLARPVDAVLRERVDDLAAGRARRRVTLGVALAPPGAANRLRAATGLSPRAGLLVRSVADGGLAATAGVLRGDVIISVDGTEVRSVDDLLDGLDRSAPDSLRLEVVRGEDEHEVVVGLTATDVDATD